MPHVQEEAPESGSDRLDICTLLTSALQCDQNPSGCGNCGRARLPCPGYRNQVDLMFVHETSKTVTKEQQSITVQRPRTTLSQPVEDLALGYFYKVHVIPTEPGSNVACITVKDECLLASMKALGLAAYASITNQQDDRLRARQYYGIAIVRLNKALASRSRATLDSTLLSVVLLSYFENVTRSDYRSVEAWSQHIRGTAALIDQRGTAQMLTPEGRMLFLMVSSSQHDCLFRSSHSDKPSDKPSKCKC